MLSTQELLLLIIVFAAIAAILSGKLRADVVALIVLLALGVTRIVTPEEALSGFSSPAIINLIGLFIISHALEETGAIQWLADRLRQLGGGHEGRLIVMFMATSALLSLFMKSVAAASILLPVTMQVARDSDVRPSRLLIPLSFGTLVGGMATFFTTANIIISDILVEQGQQALGMMDFLPTGGLIVLVALAYMALIGRRLLPKRDSVGQNVSPRSLSRTLTKTYQLEERMWEVKVLPGSRLVDVPLSQSGIGETLGLTVLAIWRGREAILIPEPMERICADDYLLLLGREERVAQLGEWGLDIGRGNGHVINPHHDYSVDLTEVVIPPRSAAVGRSLRDLRFRNKYGLTTVALWREGRSYRTDVGTFPLQVGDALLMVGPVKRIKSLANERDYLVLQSSHAVRPPHPEKMLLAVLITAVTLAIAILGLLSTPEALLIGVVALVVTGCLNIDEAYRGVEWRVIFLVAGMLPVSIAMVNTGLADRIGNAVIASLSPYGPLALLAGLIVLTILIVQVVGSQVTAVIFGTIAVHTALQVGINPQAVGVAVAIACSTAFLTPIAHPGNILVMGPGGYKPADFTRVGLGMTLVVFVVLLACMVLIWGVG
ncbi:MAG TPA: SLC13 family permease [Oceanobacillus sp.]|nr:SLC13 family permease [Oceanobacillus sp.]